MNSLKDDHPDLLADWEIKHVMMGLEYFRNTPAGDRGSKDAGSLAKLKALLAKHEAAVKATASSGEAP